MTQHPEQSEDETLATRLMLRAYRPDWGAESLARVAVVHMRRLVAEAEAILTARPQASMLVLDFVAFWSDAGRAGLAPNPGPGAAILTAAAHWAVPEDFQAEHGEPFPALPPSEVLAGLTGIPLEEISRQLARLRRFGVLEGGRRSGRGERFSFTRMSELVAGAPWPDEAIGWPGSGPLAIPAPAVPTSGAGSKRSAV